MAPDRWVVLDDTNPSIKYTGSWSQDSGSQDQVGNFGPSYLHTLHGTSVDGSVEFDFNGTAVEVWGNSNIKNAKTNPDPTLECFVDDISIGRDDPFEFPENNWRFCAKAQLPDGHHTLRIDVKVVSKDQTFWLDQLRYIPSPNLPLDNQVVLFDNTDPAIQFDSEWRSLGSTANMTTHRNSIAQVNFIGTSVSWVAFVPTELPHTGATGTWAIDGGEPTQFLLPGLPATNTITIYNQFYFTTTKVEAGPHSLTVTFLGDNTTTPLCLDYLYVQNGTFPTSVSNSTTTPEPNPHGDPDQPSSDPHIGVILGGVLGGLAFLVIIAGGLLIWKRREARHKQKFISIESSEHTPIPFDPYSDNHPDPNAQGRRSQFYAVPSVSGSEVTPSFPTHLVQQPLGVTRKQQEALGSAAPHRPLNDEIGRTGHAGIFSESTSLPWPQATATEVQQYMDSGIRLDSQPAVDIPPHYTPN